MPFVKLQKNKAYYKRFQTKYRRRREGKTDYYARKRLVTQAKNKYSSPKYRFVVRFSNRDITTQIIYAKITGDVVLCAAYAHELPRYGIENGLTNYAAAYATGLLCARRVLTHLNLATHYPGNAEVTGEKYEVEPVDDGPKPFKAFLDVGLRPTTTGSRVFGALKGAVDGGLAIPYSEQRFPGYDKEKKALDADTLRSYIYGGHVQEYMEYLLEEDDEAYKRQFSRYIAKGVEPDSVEELYSDAHKAIREDPVAKKSTKEPSAAEKAKFKKFKQLPKNLKQRRDTVRQKIEAFKAKLANKDE